MIDVFDVISETINSDHELGLDMYFGDRIVQTLSMLDEGLPGRLGPAGIEKVWEVIDESLDESPPFLMPGALKAIQELSSKPVKLGIVSNTGNSSNRAYGRMFKAMGIDGFFEVVSLSNELAMAKPCPEIFRHTLDGLGVAPSPHPSRWRQSSGGRRRSGGCGHEDGMVDGSEPVGSHCPTGLLCRRHQRDTGHC